MSQRDPFGSANDKYKRKLFVDTGMEFVEVKARIIEPYSTPSPQPQVKEIKIINAPSHFHQMGVSSYKAILNMLFKDKEAFRDYSMYVGWTHKFYDERGNIYFGVVESIKADPVFYHQGDPNIDQKGYKVELTMTLIKKDGYDATSVVQFQDLETTEGKDHWARTAIEDMANLGIVVVTELDGTPVLYFRPEDFITRAEFVTFLMRTKRLIERIIRE
ncbi:MULTISPECIES: S-layer homology domain-containing protein [unclassified Paenibacillus]|uniref:S-layer homology domain-containing protein n=1 Tax=unclassified Paenibacillus TaxID=185978 RepID=UPI0008968BEC|nr:MULTISPECIES: S-layer homology domain-containing protein [unclassified Paenibacillus]OMC68649.1 S-layer protein [Paenibacillus sp. FSL H7-0326]SDW56216.1 S-layer homology domain-containing protein [Paenibacillus sp. PDC88]